MENDEMKKNPEETVDETSEPSETSAPEAKASHEGQQSADAMFGEEAARSGIIPGLTDRDVASEVQTAFLDYSMSVIVSRAIPDVRDGLKPVQRRIIYGMNESGMLPNKPYKKCARIVGDVGCTDFIGHNGVVGLRFVCRLRRGRRRLRDRRIAVNIDIALFFSQIVL